MKPSEDVDEKRREYEDNFAITQGKSVCGEFVMVLFAIAALWNLSRFAMSLFNRHYFDLKSLGCVLLFALVAAGGWVIGLDNTRKAKSIPYVPSVADPLAALPADEILLRGSNQPSVRPDELLRPAQVGTETAPEELLRAQQTALDAELRTLQGTASNSSEAEYTQFQRVRNL